MVSGRNNRDQDPARVSDGDEEIEELPRLRLPCLSRLEQFAHDSRVVQHGASDAERVPEMHGRHCGQGIYIFPAHPHTFRVVVSYAIEEAVLAWEQARWHAWIYDENYKCEEVREGHGSSDDRERVEGRSDIVIPRDKS